MDTKTQADLNNRLRHFLRRDYGDDARRLNEAWGKNSGTGAGFAPCMPPVPYTGNPFNLSAENCIAFFGLNPRWRGWDDRWAGIEYLDLKRSVDNLRKGDDSAFENYKKLRASYFDADSRMYYGAYYTRLGGYLGEIFCGKIRDGASSVFARRIFREHVFKADFLPWFSKNTDDVDWEKVTNSDDDALDEYHTLLLAFLAALKPRWIQCNGKQSRPLAEKLFKTKFEDHSLLTESEKKVTFYFGYAQLSSSLKIPVLGHSFGRFQNREKFVAIATRFRTLATPEIFQFS